MFNGLPIVVVNWMAGMKKAVMLNGTLYVSPAMWALMKDAGPDELEHLLRHLPLVDMGTHDFGSLGDAMVTTCPGRGGDQ